MTNNKKSGLYFKNFSFTPGLIPTLAFFVLFFLTIWAGFWQLSRAEQKQNLIIDYQALQTSKPITLRSISGHILDYRYSPITIKGHVDNQHTILLDNKTYKGHVGYQVISPVKLANNQAVLVNRGWVVAQSRREQLPNISEVAGKVTLTGIIKPINNTQLVLNNNTQTQLSWPLRIQKVDVKKLEKKLGYPLKNFVILLSPKSPYGYVREWSPLRLNPQKNTAYAFQWFALAFALIIIYLIVNTHRLKPEDQGERDDN